MSDLRQILEELAPIKDYEDKEELVDQALSQIKAWIEENVIGEDEKTGKVIVKTEGELYAIRNQLRQSQRQQLREETK